MKIKLFLNLFASALLFCQVIPGNASISESKIDRLLSRDPFSPLIAAHCFIDQQEPLYALKDWRLFGIVGRKDKWQSWVTNSQQQWLPLKKGDLLPNSDLRVAAITNHFTKFVSHSSASDNCETSDMLKLSFEEPSQAAGSD